MVSGWEGLINQGEPDDLLNGMAAADQLSASRAESLNAFEEATKALRTHRDGAKKALAEANQTRDELSGRRPRPTRWSRPRRSSCANSVPTEWATPTAPIQYTGPASGNAKAVLDFAFAQVGKPYQYGGTGPGSWDCSGLVQASWNSGGVNLPRTTWEQWSWGASRKVSLNDLQPGDLLFSEGLGHVGIYAGNGQMVHAPQPGSVVKVVPLSSYGRRFVGAVRP